MKRTLLIAAGLSIAFLLVWFLTTPKDNETASGIASPEGGAATKGSSSRQPSSDEHVAATKAKMKAQGYPGLDEPAKEAPKRDEAAKKDDAPKKDDVKK